MALQQHFDDEHTDHQVPESITLDVSSALYIRLKMAANNQNQTIHEYLKGLLEHAVPEYEQESFDIIEELRKLREQVLKNNHGEFSKTRQR